MSPFCASDSDVIIDVRIARGLSRIREDTATESRYWMMFLLTLSCLIVDSDGLRAADRGDVGTVMFLRSFGLVLGSLEA